MSNEQVEKVAYAIYDYTGQSMEADGSDDDEKARAFLKRWFGIEDGSPANKAMRANFVSIIRSERLATEARVRDEACNALNAWYRGETRHESPIAAIRAAGKENGKS